MTKRWPAIWGLLVLAISLGLMLPGCSGKKRYPDPNPGWHTADYHLIFGRLQRIAGKNPEDPPLWIIRYGFNREDKYAGKLYLKPPEKMTGFTGGETVQITGQINSEYVSPLTGGTWYDVKTIRIWSSTKPQ